MEPLIETHGLGWRYAPIADGGHPIVGLDGIGLTIRAGEFIGVVGPTGAGKSTLCMALAGIIPNLTDGDMDGRVTVAGRDTADISVAELSERVGYVQQDPESQLFCASVEDEIAFPLENRGMDPDRIDERIDAMLDLVGLPDMRGRAPTSLSGGQMQRVALAAALAPEPDILVLDEPTSALDPEGRREVFAALDAIRRRRGLTVVMAEQDTTHLAGWADRILVLDHGRIVAQGDAGIFATKQELLDRLGIAPPTAAPSLRTVPANDTDARGVRAADGHAGTDPAITLDHVTYRYTGGDQPALDDVTCTIPRGAFVGLVGCNGSGKTTLARHLNALLRPGDGRVLVDGLDTRRNSVGRMAAHVGFAFQNPDHQIFCSSTREEIGFGPKSLGWEPERVDEAVENAMKLFDLERFADVSPATLGYGDRRSVALASVLVMDTPVIVLDEPTAGLDRNLARRFLDAVAERNLQGATVIMISHDMWAVSAYCTHLMRMDAGRLVEWGRLAGGGTSDEEGTDGKPETKGVRAR